MIPQVLELKNFLSYGEPIQRVDFKDYTFICLSGKNGHGKSALLDAITWALWGQARKIAGASKADEGLVRLGQTRMMVSLEFLCSKRTYRVRREFAKTHGKPYAALDFEVLDTDQVRFISLTDKTIRTTQAKIEELIGLDYDTFVNTAFIRQGQANEFSKKSAKERKQILATILGLSKYDLLQQDALEKVRMHSETKRGIIGIVEQFANDIAQETTFITKCIAEKELLNQITSKIAGITKHLVELEQQRGAFQNIKQVCTSFAKEIEEYHNKTNSTLNGLKKHLLEWKKTHHLLLSQPDLHTLSKQKKEIENELKIILENQQQCLSHQSALFGIKDAYHKRYTTLKKELDTTIATQSLSIRKFELALYNLQTSASTKITVHKNTLEKISSLQKEQDSLEKECSTIHVFNERYAYIKRQFEKRRIFYQTLVQRGNWIKNELQESSSKQQKICDLDNPSCPLCEQLLTAKRKQFLSQQLNTHEKVLKHRLGRIATLIKKLKELLLTQHDDVQKLSKQAEVYKTAEFNLLENAKKIKELETEIEKITQDQQQLACEEREVITQISNAQKELEILELALQSVTDNDTELISLRNQQFNIEQALSAFTFNADKYNDIQKKLNVIDESMHQLSDITSTLTLQNERKQLIQINCKEIKNIKKLLSERIVYLQKNASLESDIQKNNDLISTLVTEHNQLTTQKEHTLHAIGSFEFECQRIQKIKAEHAAKMDQIKNLDREIEDYQIIATAMSKNGIQALLIEEAIPEIEHEANIILSRLTDNQSQIFIESLRDLKSGGVRETLDIQIADTLGMRSYEMYSGGEAFRIDFALRIAIAKLLARRAGTALQTLIIDEGFGSQDEEGLSHIMESLYAIQDDFSKIIIVSHLDEFKHNFPVHFIIKKSSLGSLISIEERG